MLNGIYSIDVILSDIQSFFDNSSNLKIITQILNSYNFESILFSNKGSRWRCVGLADLCAETKIVSKFYRYYIKFVMPLIFSYSFPTFNMNR